MGTQVFIPYKFMITIVSRYYAISGGSKQKLGI